MTRARKMLIAGATALVLAAGGVGIAQAVGGDSEEQATGPEAARAKRAAVDAVGGGRAVGVEREDDGGAAWEVEVRSGGREIEVKLSRDLEPVGMDREDEGREDDQREDERGDDDQREDERGDDDQREDERGDDDQREDEDDEGDED
jgi:hypothetical protein